MEKQNQGGNKDDPSPTTPQHPGLTHVHTQKNYKLIPLHLTPILLHYPPILYLHRSCDLVVPIRIDYSLCDLVHSRCLWRCCLAFETSFSDVHEDIDTDCYRYSKQTRNDYDRYGPGCEPLFGFLFGFDFDCEAGDLWVGVCSV